MIQLSNEGEIDEYMEYFFQLTTIGIWIKEKATKGFDEQLNVDGIVDIIYLLKSPPTS